MVGLFGLISRSLQGAFLAEEMALVLWEEGGGDAMLGLLKWMETFTRFPEEEYEDAFQTVGL